MSTKGLAVLNHCLQFFLFATTIRPEIVTYERAAQTDRFTCRLSEKVNADKGFHTGGFSVPRKQLRGARAWLQ